MRKVEQRLKAAWEAGRNCSERNSRVEVFPPTGRVSLYLFGNEIARRYIGESTTYWTCSGWRTHTTASRLRNVVGANLRNMRTIDPYVWYFNGSTSDEAHPAFDYYARMALRDEHTIQSHLDRTANIVDIGVY